MLRNLAPRTASGNGGLGMSYIIVTKRALVEARLIKLPDYQARLARPLIYGAVGLPRKWLTQAESVVVRLDLDAVLDAQQADICRQLLDRVVDLCARMIPGLIDLDLDRRTESGATPQRLEIESLRRGRGPAAVRDLLFREVDRWPEDPVGDLHAQLGVDLAQTLDRTLAARRAARSPSPARRTQVRALLEPTREIVRAYAVTRGCANPEWLVSEVIDQLVRNGDNGLRLPDDLQRWALATASKKLKAGRHPRAVRPPRRYRPPRQDDLEDTTARLTMQQDMATAARRVEHLADELAAVDAEQVDVVAHRVAAAALKSEDWVLVADIVDASPEGVDYLTTQWEHFGLRLTRGRRIGVIRIIRETLRVVLEPPQDLGGTASS